ncbi:MAG: hypothetical protein ABW277_15025 [Longimicrobiaceae bacterium]
MRDVIREILAAAHDMVLVDQGEAAPEEPSPIDVLVLSMNDPENEAVPARMLYRAPRSRVLALSSDARHAFLYELRPHRAALGELGRERLLAAVRAEHGGAA